MVMMRNSSVISLPSLICPKCLIIRTKKKSFIGLLKSQKIIVKIVAGYIGLANCWREAFLEALWLDEQYRKQGLGFALIEYFENEVRKKCMLIHLYTFDWQAREFYVKYGYKVFGACEDCPKGHKKFYMVKYL